MTTTPCPNCGTPVELFGTGSASGICPRCGTIVRRAGSVWRTTSYALKTQFGILLLLILIVAAAVGSVRFRMAADSWLCVVWTLLLTYFVCLCTCISAPDRTARRSAIACVMTLVFGTVGWVIVTVVLYVNMRRPAGLADFSMAGTAINSAGFAIYLSAFVFLMRFHAAIAAAFGNRWLERECYVYLFFPVAATGANWWIEEFRFGPPPFFLPRDMVEFSRTVMNFGVVVWYAVILYRTFRTIDRGPVAWPDPANRGLLGDEPPGD
jgi:hypothetical protein